MLNRFEEYAEALPTVRLNRDDHGVVTMQLHHNGGAFQWDASTERELTRCFQYVGADPGNTVAILTGTGADFCTEVDTSGFTVSSPRQWMRLVDESEALLMAMLDLPIPLINAINGPAHVRSDIAILGDIVIASDSATFADHAHFVADVVPGDGAHIAWMQALGPQRGRYFLLTGQVLSAQQACDLGVVSEVVPDSDLLRRAREIAATLSSRSALTRSATKRLLQSGTQRLVRDELRHGLMHEALIALASSEHGT